jgi:alpha-tubulin suppressor-like RCC1 family protein
MRGRLLLAGAAGLCLSAPCIPVSAATGSVSSFGMGAYGQLGGGGTASSPVPLAVSLGGPVTAVAAGCFHSLALTADGAVWAWGLNDDGQLGDGSHTLRNAPVRVSGLPGQATAIAAGCHHSLALTASGQVWAWGESGQGELGDGTDTVSTRPTPVHVSALDGAGITAIAAGGEHSAAVGSGGAVYAWGDNRFGQLGGGDTVQHDLPVKLAGLPAVTGLAMGASHSLVLAADHTLLAAGSNVHGELGDGGTTDHSAPAAVAQDVAQAAAGDGFSLAVTTAQAVLAWGRNDSGQLGAAPSADRTKPAAVSGADAVVAVAAGGRHALAVTAAGAVLTWGDGGDGQLGDATDAGRATPKALAALTSVTSVAAGDGHSLVLSGAPLAAANQGTNTGAVAVPNTSASPLAVGLPAAAVLLLATALRLRRRSARRT